MSCKNLSSCSAQVQIQNNYLIETMVFLAGVKFKKKISSSEPILTRLTQENKFTPSLNVIDDSMNFQFL